MPPKLTTDLHRISAHRYMTTVGEEWFARYWWALVLPVALCLTVGIVGNVAFTFVALILLCLVIPPVMMSLYYNYALTPEATAAVRPHTLTLHPTAGIDAEFAPNPDTDRRYAPVHVDWDEVSAAEIRSHDVVLRLAGRPYRYIIIPYFALDNNNADMVTQLHEMLRTCGKYNPVTL